MKASTFLAILIVGTTAFADEAVRFTEVMYNPPPGVSGGEWLEFYNRGYTAVSLAGWTLNDGIEFSFPDDAWIDPGAYLVVCGNIRDFVRAFPDVTAVVGDFTGQLADGGETVVLRDAGGHLVDVIRYQDESPWPKAADGQGPSVELVSFELDSDYGDSWLASRKILGTPGAPNTRAAVASANAIIPHGATWAYRKGTSEPPADWYTEAFDDSSWERGRMPIGYGIGREATELADMLNGYMSVYSRIRFEIDDPTAFASLVLEAEYDDGYVVYVNGQEAARLDYGSPGEVMPYDAPAADGPLDPRLATHPLDPSLFRPGWNTMAVQAANEAINNRDFYLDIVLNGTIDPGGGAAGLEVQVNEVGRDGDGSWIEFWNEGRAPARIGGLRLGFELRGAGTAVLPDVTVPPYGYAVVREAELGVPIDAGVFVFLLDAKGESLIDGMPILPSGASTGRYPDGDHDAYPLEVATPGARNDLGIAHDLVITEIMYHPAADEAQLEYVEIYNRGADPIPLTGWSLAGAVRFDFDPGSSIAAGQYLVIAADPDAIHAMYLIDSVVGPFRGHLRNTAEAVRILDPFGRPVDRVRYADDGDWPPQADGTGPALALTNVDGENDAPNLWAARAASPGASNGTPAEIAPILRREHQSPVVPGPDEPIAIEVEAIDDGTIDEVLLHFRPEGAANWTVAPMLDDGATPDLAASDGIFSALIPGYAAGANGTAVLWYATARDDAGHQTQLPAAGSSRPFIFRIEASAAIAPMTDLPVYRILMTDADYQDLTTRATTSDVLLPCSFVGFGRIYYDAWVRYRGQSARNCTPRSYRVEFTDERSFRGIRRLFVNGCSVQRQRMGLFTHRSADLPGPRSRWVSLVINGRFSPLHVEVERTDDDMMRRLMHGDDEGNLYRAEHDGDLDYRGTNPGQYTDDYVKETNIEEDDYSDVFELCRVFSLPAQEDFIEEVWGVADVEQWARFFAVQTVISNQEGSIYRDTGDDYFLYFRPSDGRAMLLPWDMDSVFQNPTERLFRPTLASIRRFLTAPEIAPLYWYHLRDLLAHAFSIEAVRRRIDDLPAAVSAAYRAEADAFLLARTQFIRDQLHEELTVAGSQIPGAQADLIPVGSVFRFFRGWDEPSPALEWTAPGFDDAAWESGVAGIGYGDGDDATTLSDMRNGYTTLYLRRTFTLADPAEVIGQTFWIDYDDGFVAYLNGTEIGRQNGGVAGTRLAHDAIATAGHSAIVEGGAAFTVALDGFVAAARAGTNVLAVQGLNSALDSSDLTINPAIRTTASQGTPFVAGSDGVIPYAGGALTLEGFAPAPYASRILVEGTAASYDVLTGTWSMPGITDPPASLRVRAVGAFGELVAEKVVEIVQVADLPEPAGRIDGQTLWDAAGSPHWVAGTLTVSEGGRLTIGAGASVELQPGASIRVEGELVVEGEAAEPAGFAPASASGPWNQVLVAAGGRATIDGARIRGAGSGGPPIAVEAGGTLILRDSVVAGAGTLLQAAGADVTIERCRFEAASGLVTTIALAGNGTAVIRDVEILGGGGPGIEIGGGDVRIETTIVRDRLGTGIRAAGGLTRCEAVILHRLATGASAEAGATLEVDHATIVHNGVGVTAAAGSTVQIASSILWENGVMRDGPGLPSFIRSALQEEEPGDGNIVGDPLLADPRAGDFGLLDDSPAIRAGEGGTDMGAVQRSQPGREYAGGDTDGDDALTIGDAVFLLAHLFQSGPAPVCTAVADVDDDGQLTIGDAIYLLSYLFANGAPPRRATVVCPTG
ncbi:MAG: lamin tail domain-containing protein [Planctomycetes bacterium]|nr:lamin tail domain-containing protein [Planctomycetota bacterium]